MAGVGPVTMPKVTPSGSFRRLTIWSSPVTIFGRIQPDYRQKRPRILLRNMRFVHLHVRTAVLALATLAVCGCHSAQKPVAVKPPANPPALEPSARPDATTATAPKPAPEQKSDQKQVAAQKPEAAPAEKSGTPEPAASLAPMPDPVALLVDNAENKYQTGLTNYHSGKPDDAKQNFDDALNSLLSSNLDVRSDPRLEKEFDRI